MPRIIAGALGGRTIPGPPGRGTRPTSDRVREAMFSRLDGWDAIAGARVLDLFAGTGAFAIEALSRGAASALLIEAHGPTAQRIRRTLQELGLADRAEVRTARAESALPGILAEGAPPIDLVLLDPPYDMPSTSLEDLLEVLRPGLSSEAVVVIERSSRTEPVAWPAGYVQDAMKRYGETALQYGGPEGAPDPGDAADPEGAAGPGDAAARTLAP